MRVELSKFRSGTWLLTLSFEGHLWIGKEGDRIKTELYIWKEENVPEILMKAIENRRDE